MATNEIQTTWLTQHVGVYVTPDRVVRLSGEDRQSWLNGQVTNDVRELIAGHAVYALSVSLKGRVNSDLWALKSASTTDDETDAELALVLPLAGLDAALATFEKHIIMEDVELLPDPSLRVITLQGPKAQALKEALGPLAARAYVCARLPPLPGFELWVPQPELDQALALLAREAQSLGGGVLDADGWGHAHVVLGVPRMGVDFGAETYPQEAGLKARSVSFSKGCYTGQEVVYMLEKRGQVARRLVQLRALEAPLPAPATLVTDAEGKRLGEVTSTAQHGPYGVALAYLKRVQAHAGASVHIAGKAWEVSCVPGEDPSACPIVASV
ncbi:MAG TPA: hypothetical protein VFZ61_04390 [Polyangiales bacterium]